MVKEIVEPMFASMLPGPLASLKFVKLDLGAVPMHLSEVDVHKVDSGGIKLDMNVTWHGESDIDLDGNMVPKLVRLPRKPVPHLGVVNSTTGNRESSPKGQAVHIACSTDKCYPIGTTSSYSAPSDLILTNATRSELHRLPSSTLQSSSLTLRMRPTLQIGPW